MKFKYLIISFNIISIAIALVMFLSPVSLSGYVSNVNLLHLTRPLIFFIVLLIVCVNVFFLVNFKLFSLLEREDWPALSYYLEDKIYSKGHYSLKNTRLLATSYMVVTDYASVLRLEEKTRFAKPLAIKKNVLIFGAARVLSGKHDGAAAFFEEYLEEGKGMERQWIHWFYGFSNLLRGVFITAETEFKALVVSSRDALLAGLSAYFLSGSIAKHSFEPEKCSALADEGRARVIKTLKTRENWDKEAEKSGTEIHVAIIKRFITEAGNWLFLEGINNESG